MSASPMAGRICSRHGELTYQFARADDGTVALSAEAQGATGTFALGFAESTRGAHTLIRTSLATGFDTAREEFLAGWRTWSAGLQLPRPDGTLGDAARFSAMVLKVHEDRCYPGAVVASLSVPWGDSTESLGGYHLVWPRDATLTAFALLAAHQLNDARHILAHLTATQRHDGGWPQNYFPNGTPFWSGMQLDETAFPVLLAAKLRELGDEDLPGTAQMVRAAIGYIVHAGPCSEQDRWEENPGASPFTLAVAICALIAAAPWLSAEERSTPMSWPMIGTKGSKAGVMCRILPWRAASVCPGITCGSPAWTKAVSSPPALPCATGSARRSKPQLW